MVTGSVSASIPFPGRPVPNPRMVLRFPFGQGNNTYTFEVNFTALHTGPFGGSEFHALLKTMLPGSGYCLCPGIGNAAECSASSSAKSIRMWGFPFNRVDHKKCQLWLPMPALSKKWSHSPTCEKCTALFCYLRKETRRKAAITPTRKRMRLSPSSNYPVSRLTPISRMKRLTRKRKKQLKLSKALKKDGWNVNVGEVTQDELLALVSKIQHQTRPELEKLLREADNAGQGETLRQAWKQDVEDRVAFEQDQRRNGENKTIMLTFINAQVYIACILNATTCRCVCKLFHFAVGGSRGNRWSMITIRMCKLLVDLVLT